MRRVRERCVAGRLCNAALCAAAVPLKRAQSSQNLARVAHAYAGDPCLSTTLYSFLQVQFCAGPRCGEAASCWCRRCDAARDGKTMVFAPIWPARRGRSGGSYRARGPIFRSRATGAHHAACASTDFKCDEAMPSPDEA